SVTPFPFQSPLHRGRHFIALTANRWITSRRVSVPSSSGKALHPGKPPSLSLETLCFSPLFIGEGTSSGPKAASRRQAWEFQSPLHRGRHFIEIIFSAATRTALCFSPLFIGEGTSSCDTS